MKNKVTIFVENNDDALFINFLLQKLYHISLPDSGNVGGFIRMGGIGQEKHNGNDIKFLQSKRLGYTNLVFEDADYKANSTYGFDKQKERLEQHQTELNFEFFLFPNHKEDGNLELLFESCLSAKSSQIVTCLNDYHKCLIKQGLVEKTPKTYHNRWNMIESSLLDIKKPAQRNFADDTIWWIDNNPNLQPLIDFLDRFFVKL